MPAVYQERISVDRRVREEYRCGWNAALMGS